MSGHRWWFMAVVVVACWWKGVAPQQQPQQAPAIWVMGDSLVDSGNNNFLSSSAKANYPPYGCDYYRGPTGRFCNARTFSDILGDWLGIAAPPPFADPSTTGDKIMGGVNYASAAGGILDETGQHYGDRYSLSQQVVNFETTLSQLRTMMSPSNLSQLLSNSIVVMVFGSNDYINNYLLPNIYDTSRTYTPDAFANLLLNRYATQIHALYSLGLRKFFLPGLGPLGCIPNQLATGQAPPGRCVDSVNQMLGPFNEGLKRLVGQFNGGSHPGAMFVYGNTYGVFGDIMNNPAGYGFTVRDRACCGIGRNQGQITCLPLATPCFNRDQYVFWDAFHPTQAANGVLAQRAYSGSNNDNFPMNVQQLAQTRL
ncbi:putative triacylglycerol lipase [Helianthus annuus]|nr:GDSL esterase/lipase At1g71250 [Helianthus annuus]KAJ0527177.1 putative triacylglycerol lipase [Helianthus annuus]KAJ0535824.1 putative triacylglycerol lipase [Helianthus annuus]KAJ0543579.1 putative triacylglycerol lipase [Helianthus annuus]KAJ0708633.1 putative triacylglycerol lipase [Helianthus annuus]KAJ0712551.1 putative triacylglycerol lipase [Helianthus annuus]